MALRLDARDVTVVYDAPPGAIRVPALERVDVALEIGEWRGLLGESGSGKSTLASALLGLLGHAQVHGTARLDDTELFTLDEAQWRRVRWKQVALAFQPTTSLNPAMRVDAQVAEPLALHLGLDDHTARRAAGELLDRVGLENHHHHAYPAQLSTGQKRLVLLAAALCLDPGLLLLDEPTAGLDPITRSRVLELLGGLRHEHPQMSVLLMGHDIDALQSMAIDSIQVLYAGRTVELGPAQDVLGAHGHPYTRALLHASPTLRTVRDIRAIRGTSPEVGSLVEGCAFAPRCTQALPECTDGPPPMVPVADNQIPLATPTPPPCRQLPAGGGTCGQSNLDGHRSHMTLAHQVACVRGGVVTILRARAISHGYRTGLAGRLPVLDDVDVALRAGEVLGLVGMTGAGKTTLALILAGLLRPDRGTVDVEELHVPSSAVGARSDEASPTPSRTGSPLRNGRPCPVQMVFQDPYEAISSRFTVEEAVREPLDIAQDGTTAQRTARVRDALEQVNLPPSPALLARRAHELSGGQLQRVALARALVVDPLVLLADEPVALLDPSEQARVLQLLKQLQVERGMALVFISHSLPLVLRIADTVAVLADGKVVENAPADVLLSGPASPQAAALLEAAGWRFTTFATRHVADHQDPDEARSTGPLHADGAASAGTEVGRGHGADHLLDPTGVRVDTEGSRSPALARWAKRRGVGTTAARRWRAPQRRSALRERGTR